jgi:geranylgeranyl pyrophosphate synthase
MLSLIYELCLSQEQQSSNPHIRDSLMKVMDLLSIAFQIEDDVLNITENELSNNKGFLGEDIYEGKLSLMVIKAIEFLGDAESKRLRDILQMKTKDQKFLNEAIKLINLSGGLDYAVNFSEKCVKEATDICDSLPTETKESQEALYEIQELIKYMIKRKI